VRALGLSSKKHSEALPAVLPIAEVGVPGYEATQWYGFVAPAGVSAEIIARLHAEAVKALTSKDVKDKLATDGAEPVGNTPAEFGAFIKEELDKWTRVAKQAGIEPQ
jgi:tripartite-type tricarboxylate transporter receptor subunit TctC